MATSKTQLAARKPTQREIIDGLRGRGYRLVTVSQLLGNRMIYRPVP